MEIKYHGVKLFLYDKLVEAAVYYGIFPEVQGGLAPQNQKNIRLRTSFRNFTVQPGSDSADTMTGEVIAEVLYYPGEFETADHLLDELISIFSPGSGEISNQNYRILSSSASILEHRNEGKYERTGLSIRITIWSSDAD